jgi:hypothetical protein
LPCEGFVLNVPDNFFASAIESAAGGHFNMMSSVCLNGVQHCLVQRCFRILPNGLFFLPQFYVQGCCSGFHSSFIWLPQS